MRARKFSREDFAKFHPAGARFIQFTYNLARSPESLGFKKMAHLGVSFVALNIPPARVDTFAKRA